MSIYKNMKMRNYIFPQNLDSIFLLFFSSFGLKENRILLVNNFEYRSRYCNEILGYYPHDFFNKDNVYVENLDIFIRRQTFGIRALDIQRNLDI